jgi:hypothetical protein
MWVGSGYLIESTLVKKALFNGRILARSWFAGRPFGRKGKDDTRRSIMPSLVNPSLGARAEMPAPYL